MRRGFGLIWLGITALIAGVASYFSYQAGMAQGLATKLPEGAANLPYYYGPHWGFGFFPFFGLFWFFLILLFFGWIFRRAAYFGRGGGGGGHWNREERLREWHKQAHEASPGEGAEKTTS